jgi:hypothetical protein
MNKKGGAGAGSKLPYYAVFIFYFVPLILLFILAARAYIDGYLFLDQDVLDEVHAERVFSCVGVRDLDLERTYPIIDATLVNDARIDECFSQGKSKVHVGLEEQTGRLVAGGENSVQEVTNRVKPFKVVYMEGGVVKSGVLKVSLS